ncbi:MAG: tetratricopeptide repeat protein [Opitutaceae bacterium]|nr:tetratricopeptide repeat protein [Opitutaceae bacterium]
MSRSALRHFSLLFAGGLLAAVLAGCSRQSGPEAAIKRADAFFAQGDYEKAELEYKNALQRGATGGHSIGRLGMIYFDQGRVSLGYRFLRRALELSPDDLAVRTRLAHFDFSNGKPGDARQGAIFILGKDPAHVEAPVILAETVANLEEANDARTRLRTLPGGAADRAPALVGLAVIDMRERKFKEAEALLELARKADPKFHLTPAVAAQVHMAQGDSARAEQGLAEAAELAPPRSQIRIQYARYLFQNQKLEAGRRLLEERIAKTPDFLPAYLALADALNTAQKYDDAVGLLEKIIARDAEHPEALILMGQVRLRMGDKERAITTLERAIALYPRSAPVHFQLGAAQESAGNLAAASASFAQALRIAPNYVPAAMSLAQVQARQGDFANAVKTIEPLARREPPIVEARSLLAAALRGQGALDEALKLYRQLAEANPKIADFPFLVASVLEQKGQADEARSVYAALHEQAPDYLPAIERLVRAELAQKQFAPAIARLEAYSARNPTVAAPHLMLANVYLVQPDNAKAETALKKAIELQPDAHIAYSLLSKIYLDTNQTDKAIANLRSTVAKNPNDFGAHFVLGTIYEAQKNYPAARDAYEATVAANPKMGHALNNLSYIYAEHLVDLDKAQDAAQRAREALPGQGEVADSLGWILFKKGQYPRAVALLEEAAEKLPDNADVRLHLGLACYMSGQEAAARTNLELALKLKPDVAGAADARQCLAVLSTDITQAATARPVLEKAVATRKDDPVANLRLAALLEREGNAEKALAAYEVALKTNPSLVPAIVAVMRIHASRNETAKAIALGREARKLVPGDTQLTTALGRLSYQSGDFTGALSLLQDAARRQPDDAEILFDLADATYALGQLTPTENALNDALRLAPNSPRAPQARQHLALIALAQNPADAAAANQAADAALKADANSVPALMVKAALDERSGNTKAAQQTYDKILTRFTDFRPAMRRLAIIWSTQPDLPKNAAEVAGKARDAFPGDGELTRAFGVILFRQGNFARAATLLQESARTLTKDADLLYYLGRAQIENKDADAGKRTLERALALGLKDEFAQEARRLSAPPAKK